MIILIKLPCHGIYCYFVIIYNCIIPTLIYPTIIYLTIVLGIIVYSSNSPEAGHTHVDTDNTATDHLDTDIVTIVMMIMM